MTFDEPDVFFKINEDSSSFVILVDGALHLGQRKYFEKGLSQLTKKIKYCEIDLSHATHFDSSAVSMLLVLREHKFCKGAEFTIRTSGNTTINKILKLHCLEKLFTII